MRGKREINKRFFLISFVLLAAFSIPFLFIGINTSSKNFFSGFLAGSVSNWIVASAFFSLVLWSYQRTSRVFYLSLFGGMVAKMVVLSAVIIISIAFFHINYIWLIVSVMVYYLAFQALEIIFFAKYFKE